MKPLIEKLKRQARQFEAEAKATKDKFNKVYFEGKAEQNLKIIDAIEAEDMMTALKALDEY